MCIYTFSIVKQSVLGMEETPVDPKELTWGSQVLLCVQQSLYWETEKFSEVFLRHYMKESVCTGTLFVIMRKLKSMRLF